MGAFGKDDKTADNIDKYRLGGSYRQRNAALQENRKQEHTARGGGGRRYSDVYRLNKIDFDIIRLQQGEFELTGGTKEGHLYTATLEYWPYWSHFFAMGKGPNDGKSIVCSGGPFHFLPDKANPCLGEIQEKAGAKNVNKSERYAFSLIHFAPYHKVASLDDKGQVRKSDKTGEPFFDWIRCGGKSKCENCKTALDTRPYHRLHISFSWAQFQTLTNEYDYLIGKSCVSCRSRDSIEWKCWACSHCGEVIFERGVTDLEDAEVRNITLKKVRCPTCKAEDYLDEVVECAKCDEPRRAGIFDVNLHVKGIEGKGKGLGLLIGNWSEPCPLDPGIPEDLRKPLNLPRLYAPDSVDAQARFLQIKLDGSAAPSGETRAYGGETPNYGR